MLLYLDTCIVIYLVEEHHVYCPVIETALADTTADLCFSPAGGIGMPGLAAQTKPHIIAGQVSPVLCRQ